jgi:hypothetical protein
MEEDSSDEMSPGKGYDDICRYCRGPFLQRAKPTNDNQQRKKRVKVLLDI